MTILLLLVPISVVLLGIAIWAFVWAVRNGQFENLDSAALDVLVEEEPVLRGTDPPGEPHGDRNAD